jgi:outer membrane lipoprotein-sorting protein
MLVNYTPGRRSYWLLAGALLLFLPYGSSASPKPSAVLAEALSKLESLRTYRATIDDTLTLQPSMPGAASRVIHSTDYLTYEQPNRLELVSDGFGGATIVSDGKVEYMYSNLSQSYIVRPAPTDILAHVIGGITPSSIDWLTEVRTVGAEKITGIFHSGKEDVMVELIFRSSDFLPEKATVKLAAITSATGTGLQITRTQVFTNQVINAAVPISSFHFTPPDGSTKVNAISDLGEGFNGLGNQ